MTRASRQAIKVMCVAGARPNFVKIAPLLRALAESDCFDISLVHTGQHYDHDLNDVFFKELRIRAPDVELAVGSGTHAAQTGRVMIALEPEFDRFAPDVLIVVGDVNSTLAAALVAAKKNVPVAHVEAGLRSFDRLMPEEINRVIVDQISDVLYITETSARANLLREGIADDRIVMVGNVMIDSLLDARDRRVPPAATFTARNAPAAWIAAAAKGHALLTLHRPSNVDDPVTLARILGAIRAMADQTPVIFPAHPRTRHAIDRHGLGDALAHQGIWVTAPLSYLELVGILDAARVVLTDSGGLQEEATGLGVPCLTLRETTERPATVDLGTNTIVGTDPDAILNAWSGILAHGGKSGRIPELWDGAAATRIAQDLARRYGRAS